MGKILFLSAIMSSWLIFAARAADPIEAPTPAQSSASPTGIYSDDAEMNGIRYLDYKDFFSWEQVTVRYRKDTGELRFVYANPLAIKSLKSGTTDYPDGSVFVKAAFLGQEDKVFPSSIVPNGTRRFQLMVRNKALYKDSGGWGYALFKTDGTKMGKNVVARTKACAACHAIVPERGLVFSQLLTKAPVVSMADELKEIQKNQNAKSTSALTFKDVSVNKAWPSGHLARALLNHRFKSVRSVQTELTKTFRFAGTYVEIIPFLVKEARRTGGPAALIDDKEGLFSLVYPLTAKELACASNETPMLIAMGVAPAYLQNAQGMINLEVRKKCLDHMEDI
jgi:hypothetical protein